MTAAVLVGMTGAGWAQTNVLSVNFDTNSPGAFGTTYNVASGGNVTATIVAPGAGGAGEALKLSGNVTSGVSENAGVNSPFYPASNNTDANLSDYTLGFDLALTAGANLGVGVYLNIFGGTGQANGSSYVIPISQNTVGGGFQHYSVNLGTLPTGYQIPALDPASSQYQFQLLLIGYNATVTATPETIELDNLQITVTPGSTSSQTNPPPSGTNTSAPYYVNPPIYADYPDPDIIRVGNDFYFSTTTFIDNPGLTIMHSQDLVHWEFVTHLVNLLTGSPNYSITNGVQNYRNGVFASSLRYNNGTFYVVETPNGQNTSIYYATNIAGPWQSHLLSTAAFDPGLYIENSTGYIVTAGGWQNNTTFLTLNPSFSGVVATTVITNGLGLEGSHLVKVNGYYYIFNSQPATGNFYVSRAPSLFGPYTYKNILNNGTGGHQGAIVDLPDGSYYGFVMKDSGAIGRMTYISPVFWTNNWPVFGTVAAPGLVPAKAPMPVVGTPAYKLLTSDDFSSPNLGLQWQFNHNPDNTRWSLTARPGYLRLHPTGATNFWYARNTLIQKGQGPWSGAEVKFDISQLQAGDICGLGTLGKTNGNISVTCNHPGSFILSQNVIVPLDSTDTNLATKTVATAAFTGTTIYLRTALDFIGNLGTCFYSSDGLNWTKLGVPFNLAYYWATGTFQGEQFALFCYNPQPGTGYLDVDWFRFTPPAFISGIVSTNSGAVLHFVNSPGSTNILQATTNLAIWQNIWTNVADGNGFWQWTDTNAPPGRFYRSFTP